jgi:hypothetical protein
MQNENQKRQQHQPCGYCRYRNNLATGCDFSAQVIFDKRFEKRRRRTANPPRSPMKRFHIALAVANLDASIIDYSARLGQPPTAIVPGAYAMWRTDLLNFPSTNHPPSPVNSGISASKTIPPQASPSSTMSTASNGNSSPRTNRTSASSGPMAPSSHLCLQAAPELESAGGVDFWPIPSAAYHLDRGQSAFIALRL